MSRKEEDIRKGRGCLTGVIILLVILVAAGGIGWMLLTMEHREAASLPLDAVDFHRLSDGSYHGMYAGGMYKWRANECDVTVAGGKVTFIQLSGSVDDGAENTDHQVLFERVIEKQSLQVDTISSATLTSKAYLQCVESALLQAN
jgi:uncharacterized protein with FMN-binding domain